MIKIPRSRTAALTVCLAALVPLPTLADSTSSASSAASTSVGSSSASIEKSSNSSSAKDRVAQGHYTVVAVAEIPQKPGLLRVQLQQAVAVAKAAGTDDPAALAPNTATATTEFFLTLPRATAERAQLVAGQTITAEQRPYGLAFALVNTQTGLKSPFFLVLDDAWFRELESHPLGV